MSRLRDVEAATAAQVVALGDAWRVLAVASENQGVFSRRWRAIVRRWSFYEVNDLIDRHNLWYPVESRLPMDPRTGDYALVNGRDYRRRPLDPSWVFERYPADRATALSG